MAKLRIFLADDQAVSRVRTFRRVVGEGIMADFLIALYDQDARKILEVGRAAGWLCVWQPDMSGPTPRAIAPTFLRTRYF